MVVQAFGLEFGRMEMFCCSSLVIWGCGGGVVTVVQAFGLEFGRMEMFCCSSLVIWGCGGVVWWCKLLG